MPVKMKALSDNLGVAITGVDLSKKLEQNISNEKVDGKFIGVVAAGDFWHSDQSYRKETALATFLYAHKLPKQGGDTEFADMHGAYESLPDDIKKRIEGRTGI